MKKSRTILHWLFSFQLPLSFLLPQHYPPPCSFPRVKMKWNTSWYHNDRFSVWCQYTTLKKKKSEIYFTVRVEWSRQCTQAVLIMNSKSFLLITFLLKSHLAFCSHDWQETWDLMYITHGIHYSLMLLRYPLT